MEQTIMTPNPNDNASRRRKKRAFIIAGVFLIAFFVMFLNYAPVLRGNEAQACTRCHSMTPEYMTWQQSSHAQFQCKDCHREEGVTNFFKYQIRIISDFFSSGDNSVKPVASASMPDSVCLRCHSQNRKYSPFSDTIIPHKKHMENGVRCVQCHAGIAHGRIAERGILAQISADQWNDAVAAEQMDYKYTAPRMAICLDCHGERRVTTTCSVCHSKQIVPASHKSKGWDRQHGISARNDFKPCNLCHSYTLKNNNIDLTNINVSQYIQANTFCYNCHLNKPPSHKNDDFRKSHGQMVKERGMSNCLACHNINKTSGLSISANKVYCNSCHWFNKQR